MQTAFCNIFFMLFRFKYCIKFFGLKTWKERDHPEKNRVLEGITCIRDVTKWHGRCGLESSVLPTYHSLKKKKCVTFWFHTLCRNCLLKHTIEGKKGGRKQVKEKRARNLISYWIGLRRTENNGSWKRRSRVGRRYGPVVRQTTECKNVLIN